MAAVNWDAIGAIGELVGAIAVVVSLLYLAVQIRQNTRMMRSAAIQSVTERMQFELYWSHELSEIWAKVIQDPDALSEAEAFALGEWLTAAMIARQNEFIQYRQKLIDEALWRGSVSVIRMIMAIPWTQGWWKSFDKSTLTPGFVELVDAAIAEGVDFDVDAYMSQLGGGSD